jgi:hypothetical protein
MESAENQPTSSNQPKKTGDLSRIETIELLNDSIDRLEQTIKNISQDSAKLPSSKTINSLLATTKELAANTIAPAPEPVVTAATSQVKTIAPEPVATTPTPVETTASTQTQVETKPKSSEPKPKIVKKSRQKNLISIILGVTAIATAIVAVFWLWLPNQQATTSILDPVVSEPTTEIVTNLDDAEPTVDRSEPLTEDNITVEEVELSAEASDTLASEEIVITPIPQDLESPARAENLKLVEIEPKVIFTPEQTLVAALPTRISQAIEDYTDFVEAIEVNLPQSRLVVEITDDWYSLDEARQNKLAGKMLERSRQLDFNKLELKDSTGRLVARNPVIGDRIIILESRKSDKQPILNE